MPTSMTSVSVETNPTQNPVLAKFVKILSSEKNSSACEAKLDFAKTTTAAAAARATKQ